MNPTALPTSESVAALWARREAAFADLRAANQSGLRGPAVDRFTAAMDAFRDGMAALCAPLGPNAWMLDLHEGRVTVIERPGA